MKQEDSGDRLLCEDQMGTNDLQFARELELLRFFTVKSHVSVEQRVYSVYFPIFLMTFWTLTEKMVPYY